MLGIWCSLINLVLILTVWTVTCMWPSCFVQPLACVVSLNVAITSVGHQWWAFGAVCFIMVWQLRTINNSIAQLGRGCITPAKNIAATQRRFSAFAIYDENYCSNEIGVVKSTHWSLHPALFIDTFLFCSTFCILRQDHQFSCYELKWPRGVQFSVRFHWQNQEWTRIFKKIVLFLFWKKKV